jgi:hypothetical protein
MGSLLLTDSIGANLAIVGADALILLKIVVKEASVIRVLAHTQSSGRNAVQRVHVIGDRAGVLRGSRGGDRA